MSLCDRRSHDRRRRYVVFIAAFSAARGEGPLGRFTQRKTAEYAWHAYAAHRTRPQTCHVSARPGGSSQIVGAAFWADAAGCRGDKCTKVCPNRRGCFDTERRVGTSRFAATLADNDPPLFTEVARYVASVMAFDRVVCSFVEIYCRAAYFTTIGEVQARRKV